jgi:hypothetical protein
MTSDATSNKSQSEIEKIGFEIKEKLGESLEVEQAISTLKQKGVSKLGSIHVLIVCFGYSRQNATNLIHESEAWTDRKLSDERNEAFILRELNDWADKE